MKIFEKLIPILEFSKITNFYLHKYILVTKNYKIN